MIRLLILRALVVIGYPMNLLLAWLCGGPEWFTDHNELARRMWRGDR